VGDDPLTAPETLTLRRTFSRSYYAFRPDCYYWALAILLRKLLLVTTFVIFNQVPAFQLAACILILFFAYAAQARYKPYMPVSDFDDAVRDHQLASLVPNSLHAALAARLRDVDTRGRKTARKNFMMAKGHTSRVNRLVAIAFNLNTLELILLFGAILVNLMVRARCWLLRRSSCALCCLPIRSFVVTSPPRCRPLCTPLRRQTTLARPARRSRT